MKTEGEKMEGMGFDVFNSWMKSQKEVSDTLLKSQRELMDNWMSTTRNMQASFLALLTGEKSGGAKSADEITKLAESWRLFMYDSSKVLNDNIVRMQDGWKTAFDKQMDMSKELAKKAADVVRPEKK